MEKENSAVVSTRQFVWNGNGRSEERDGSSSLGKVFLGLGQQNGSMKSYYSLDRLGSICDLTSEDGDVIARYSYFPFGESTLTQGSFVSDFQFAGMYVHARSGLNLALFRAYSSRLAIWLSRDPVNQAGSDIYSYASNNPINLFDPLGLESMAGGMADSQAGGMSDSQAGTMADSQSEWPCGGSMATSMAGSMAASRAASMAGSAESLIMGSNLLRIGGGARAISSADPRVLLAAGLVLETAFALRRIYMNAEIAFTSNTIVSKPGDPSTDRLDRQLSLLGRNYTGHVLGWYNQRVQARIVEWSLINSYALAHGGRSIAEFACALPDVLMRVGFRQLAMSSLNHVLSDAGDRQSHPIAQTSSTECSEISN